MLAHEQYVSIATSSVNSWHSETWRKHSKLSSNFFREKTKRNAKTFPLLLSNERVSLNHGDLCLYVRVCPTRAGKLSTIIRYNRDDPLRVVMEEKYPEMIPNLTPSWSWNVSVLSKMTVETIFIVETSYLQFHCF